MPTLLCERMSVLFCPAHHSRPRAQVSAGGLVSALMGVGNFQARWIGWPGVYVEDGADRSALTSALAAENYIPVYLDANIVRAAMKAAVRRPNHNPKAISRVTPILINPRVRGRALPQGSGAIFLAIRSNPWL